MPKKKACKPSRARAKRPKQQRTYAQEQTQVQSTTTETTNFVLQQQTQELTQSLLLASISSILHLRDLINPACFRLTHFDVDSSEPWSYEDWKTGNVKTKHNNHTQSMHLLQREGSLKAETFMDYLENGAFDAIQKGFLRAFQLKIFTDPDHQENVLETHTLHFSYHRPAGTANKEVAGVEMVGPEGKHLSLVNLKIGLAEFVRSLSTYVDNLPELPEKRYFKPKLFYTDDCPDGYEAPGFSAPKTAAVIFPQNEELVKKTHRLGNYSGGFHSVDMSISHVQWLDKSDGAIPPESDLVYSKQVSATPEMVTQTVELEAPLQHQAAFDTGRLAETSRRATKLMSQPPQTQTQEALPRSRSSSVDVDVLRSRFKARPTISDLPTEGPTIAQKDSGVYNERQALGGLLAPGNATNLYRVTTFPETPRVKESSKTISERESSLPAPAIISQTIRRDGVSVLEGNSVTNATHGDQVLQRNATQSGLDSQDGSERLILKDLRQKPESQAHDTQPMGYNNAATEAANASIQEHNRLRLTRAKIEELNEKRRLRDTCGLRTQSEKNKVGSTDVISCQCGLNQEEEDNMGASDTRIPLEHACYRCLEDVVESGGARRRLKELKNFTLLRRAIRTVEDNGFHDETSFAQAIGGCNLQTASDVVARLLSEKAVFMSDSGKKSVFNKANDSRCKVVTTEPERSVMMNKFFNPLYNVENYVSRRQTMCNTKAETDRAGKYVQGDHGASQRNREAQQSVEATSQESQGDRVALSQASDGGQPRNTSGERAGLIGRSSLSERSQFRLKSDLKLNKGPKSDDARKRISTDGLNPPRPTKRIYHASPMVFTRGMSADA
ncbi:meiosis specific protein hop1 [Diplodia corticola]|uniref:Meiosis specific protein hop1 n=1 Tax=Diplodia corticola TaxID=236234 RepID=A0A1J9SKU4_9PEZI|nr:meiosis specific protein hop1 [Diplodia corticola]OJD40356.1 meiosis specific protein hop1 [Diplodia corticola]